MLPRLHRALLSLLDHPRLGQRAVLLAVVLALPSLFVGAAGDDWAHRAVLGQVPPFLGVDPLLHLFRFLGPGVVNENMASAGLLPWWADPGVRAAFFRPVSALTHIVDHALWPDSDLLQHAHSLLWAGLMVGCAGAFLKEVAGLPRVAGLALLLFAVEDAHAVPLSWLANRNALLTTTFSVLAIHAYVRWRRSGAWSMWFASLGALGVGLLAGEASIGAAAWMGAFALTQEDDRLKGLLALAGPAAVVVAWRLAYDALGFGADLSGLYIDPGATPAVWMKAAVMRWPVLMGGLLTSMPVDGWGLLPDTARMLASLAGLLVVLAGVYVVAPAVRARPGARMAALAVGLILLPSTATFPMDRLFTLASLAAALLVAEVAAHHGLLDGISESSESSESSAARPSVRMLALVGLLLWHGPVAAAARPVRCATLPLMGLVFDHAAETAPTDDALAEQTLVFVHANDFAVVYTFVKRSVVTELGPRPRGVALMSSWWTDVAVERLDAHTLRLTPEEGFLARPIDHLMRDPARAPFTVGERLSHYGFDVVVQGVSEDGRPTSADFIFASPLEDDRERRFVRLTDEGAVPWTPPEIGQTIVLDGLL